MRPLMNTEGASRRYADLDLWPTDDVVAALVDSQMAAIAAVHAARDALVAAADAAVARLDGTQGRIVYVGAGSSGRLAVQDGVELYPTYGWPHDRLVYLLAGGQAATVASVEGAEDDADGAREAVAALVPTADDVVIGVAASGRTPYTLAALHEARAAGALTIGLSNNAAAPLLTVAEIGVALVTGAEVVAGSTRMAAGTAQKAALNALSTAIMVRLGRTHGNLMVDLSSSNIKLNTRRLAMLRSIVAVDEPTARAALAACGGHVKTAVLVALGLPARDARALLVAHKDRLRPAMAALRSSGF
jgi:N-acetylmuramic acid 6-phosphate etherase